MRRQQGFLIGILLLLLIPAAESDTYPAGCIDCHVVTDDGTDFRVNVLLAAKGHTRINEGGDEIPGGCNYCHAPDDQGTATSMRTLMHMIHYELPEENEFVTAHNSDCRHCHSMSESDGLVGIKSGKANWAIEVSGATED